MVVSPFRLCGLLALCLFPALASRGQSPSPTPADGPKLGLQAWSFNRNTFAETLDKAQALGIRYLQAYPRQPLGGGLPGNFEPTMDPATQAKVRALLKEKGITLASFGVVRATDEAGWRQLFTFARDMGIPNLTVEPKPDVIPLLAKLSTEYGITVSIHNHGGGIEDRLAQIKPFGPNMGICADTGHWVRGGFDPIAYLRLSEGRLHSVHLKDIDQPAKEGHTVPYGTGIGNVAGQIAELKRQGFTGILFIEYEYRTPALDEDVKKCVEFFNKSS